MIITCKQAGFRLLLPAFCVLQWLGGGDALVHHLPMPHLPPGVSGTRVAAGAAAALVEAICAAQAHDGLTLRELRAVSVGAQTASQYVTGVASAQQSGGTVERWPSADLAWQAVREATMVLDDGRRKASTPNTTVGQAVVLCQAGLRHDLDSLPLDAPSTRARADLEQVLGHLHQIAHLLPVIADQLIAITRAWAKVSALHRRARGPRSESTTPRSVPTPLAARAAWTVSNLDKLLTTIEQARSESIALAEAMHTATAKTSDLARRRA